MNQTQAKTRTLEPIIPQQDKKADPQQQRSKSYEQPYKPRLD
jgi:hypothetical protein